MCGREEYYEKEEEKETEMGRKRERDCECERGVVREKEE